MTPLQRPFFATTRKEVAPSAKLPAIPHFCGQINARRLSKSFGGRLAQIRATQACDSTRRAWPSTGEFALGFGVGVVASLQAQSDKRAPSPRAVFARGEGGGRGGVRSPEAGERTSLD